MVKISEPVINFGLVRSRSEANVVLKVENLSDIPAELILRTEREPFIDFDSKQSIFMLYL